MPPLMFWRTMAIGAPPQDAAKYRAPQDTHPGTTRRCSRGSVARAGWTRERRGRGTAARIVATGRATGPVSSRRAPTALARPPLLMNQDSRPERNRTISAAGWPESRSRQPGRLIPSSRGRERGGRPRGGCATAIDFLVLVPEGNLSPDRSWLQQRHRNRLASRYVHASLRIATGNAASPAKSSIADVGQCPPALRARAAGTSSSRASTMCSFVQVLVCGVQGA